MKCNKCNADINDSDNSHAKVSDFFEDEVYSRPEEHAIENSMISDIDNVVVEIKSTK